MCVCKLHLTKPFARAYISSELTPIQSPYLQTFLNTLASLVQAKAAIKPDVAVQCLGALSGRPECRKAIWQVPGIIVGYHNDL